MTAQAVWPPDTSPGDDERRSQLLRGVLDMCLVALVAARPAYGYEVTRRLTEHGLVVSGGSIYPLLARLERSGLIAGRMVPSPAGPPRKYYEATDAGRAALRDWRETWQRTAHAVDAVVAAAHIAPKETP